MPSLSIQLFSLRSLPSLEIALATAKNGGYSFVELISAQLEDASNVKRSLDEIGLSASSSHVSLIALRERFESVMAACELLNITQLFMPASPPAERQNQEPYWTNLGRELGEFASRTQKYGVNLGYHNHHWELALQPDGRTALECLMDGAGGSRLSWQVDIAWLARGGADPAYWMQRYRDRIVSAHAKDLAIDGTGADEDGWADVGHGKLDWRGTFAPLAQACGARWLVAEHDNPSDLVRFAHRSFQFLSSL